MRCPTISFFLTIGLSGLIDGLPNPNPPPEKARRQINADSYCTDFSCTPPAVPAFNQVFNTCGCKTIPPQCTNVVCDALYHQSYENTTGKCTCELGTGIDPVPTSISPYNIEKVSTTDLRRENSIYATCPVIVCGAGNALDSSTCTCQPIWPPDACATTKCTAGHHAVYNSTSGGCGCDLDCPSLTCTTGYTSSYNSTTRVCTCQKASAARAILRGRSVTSYTINQLPPYTTAPLPTLLTVITDTTVGPPMRHTFQTSRSTVEIPPFYQPTPVASPSTTVSTAILSPSAIACRDLYCISEMTPQFDGVSGQCKCVWIPGFGPNGT